MSAFSQAVNYTGKKPKSEGRPQIGSNQAYSVYSPPASQGRAQSSYGSRQQQGGFPEIPQKGQQSAPDMSAYRQQSGFSYPPSPPPSMGTVAPPPAEGPVAVQDPSGVQRQIDRLKQMGTWDDPRNAKARERLEGQLRNINAAPPGYFVAPDGSLEPNYISSFQVAPPSPAQPQYAAQMPAMPPQRPSQPSPAPPQPAPPQPGQTQRPPQYGRGLNMPPGSMITSDVRDSDGDGIDDRFQAGPGQPPPASAAQTSYAPPQSLSVPPPPVEVRTNYMPAQTIQAPPFKMDYNTRDALIASITNSAMQQQANGFGTQGARPPQFNWPQLYQQASQMVANGWSNPLAALLG